MAKSSSTPIEFSEKAYLIAGLMTWALAALAVVTTIVTGKPLVLLLAVFWIVISVFCIRGWRAKRAGQ